MLALLMLKIEKLRFRKNDLYCVFCFLLILIPAYLYSKNEYLLRFIIYIPRFLVITVLFEIYLLQISYEKLKRVLCTVFFIHCTVILLCFIVPPLNNFLNVALGKAFTSEFRISGLFSGYDFISFFTIFYLYVEYRCNGYKFNALGYFQLFIGFSATVVSGRFGMVPYLVFIGYIFFKKINLAKVAAFAVVCVAAFFIFYERILLFYNTFQLLRDSLQLSDPDNNTLSLKDYGSDGQEGFYQLSPLVLYHEATMPFNNVTGYILPSSVGTMVDSGPSFVILNIGFILFLCLYVYYFKSIYRPLKGTVLFTVFILIMDIKFKIILVFMPTVWILLNLNRLKKYEQMQPA